jgi:hypothetical protein
MSQETNEHLIPHLVQEAASGWTQYAFVGYPAAGAVAVEARLRYWHTFTGKTYWDDVFIAPVVDLDVDIADINSLSNGGFETMQPAYWAPTGAGAEWSTEQSRSPGLSLKLSGAAGDWVMDEGVRAWVGGFPAGGTPEIEIGGWVYTEGVNVAPTDDAGKFQLVFEFFDVPGGTNVLGGPVVLDLPQDAASSGGWVELSSLSLGAIVFPSEKAATSAKVTFRQGANATGTAYLDDLFVRNLTEGWAGDWFNANMDTGDTWYYWLSTMAWNKDPWETTKPHFMYVTDAEAHSGSHSLLIEANPTYTGDNQETVAVTDRVPVTAGEPVLFSFWVKREGNTNPTEIGTGQNNLGLTLLWYNNLQGGAAGFGEIGGADVIMSQETNEHLIPHLVQEAASGWTQYAYVGYPAAGAVAVEARLRYWHTFTGKTYWDDVVIVPLGGTALVGTGIEDMVPGDELPSGFALHQNYPNPFNPVTSIGFELEHDARVNLSVFNVMGQSVASLVSGVRMPAGQHGVTFDGQGLASGVYLYVLEVNGAAMARRMVLLK